MTTVGGCQGSSIIGAFDAVYGDKSEIGKKGRKIISSYSTLLGLVRNTLSFINGAIAAIPKPLTNSLKVMKLPSVLTVPFAAKDLVKNAVNVIDLDTSVKKKGMNFLKAAVNVDKIGRAAITVCEAGKILGMWGEKAVSWIPGFSIFSLIASSISAFIGIRALIKSSIVFHSIRTGVNAIEGAKDPEQKSRAMLSLLEKLEAKGFDKIGARFKIGKDAQVAQKAQALMQKLKNGTHEARDLEEGEKFLKILKKRAGLVIGLDSFKVATSVIEVVGSIFSSFTPFPVVGLGLFGCTGTMSTISWGIDTFLIKSNPFDPASRCVAEKWVDKAKSGLQKAVHSVESAFTSCGPAIAAS